MRENIAARFPRRICCSAIIVTAIENPSDIVRARSLVLQYGRNATAYQILNPGMAHWFGRKGDSVVGYIDEGQVRVIAGSPVSSPEEWTEVVAELKSSSEQRLCFFAAESPLWSCLKSPAWSSILIGTQPVWDPAEWERRILSRSSLRAQLSRAKNKGIRTYEIDAKAAGASPVLRSVLARWINSRGLPPLHFLVEPETLDSLYDRRVFVAEQQGRFVGFLTASPIPLRKGWLIEQFVRLPEAPNGTSELMIHSAAIAFANEKYDMLTLGLAPLAAHGAQEVQTPDSAILKFLFDWIRAHGRRFYNFDGLDAFKSKFQPDAWEPIYAISEEPNISLSTFFAIGAAFTKGKPIRTVTKAVISALQQEARWMMTKRP